jgi:signal transduction histidine kinase
MLLDVSTNMWGQNSTTERCVPAHRIMEAAPLGCLDSRCHHPGLMSGAKRERAWGRAGPWLAGFGAFLLATAMVIEQIGLFGVPKGTEDGPFFTTMIVLAVVSWGAAGALIGTRRPENAIGLLLAGEAFLLGVISISDAYGRSDLPVRSVASEILSDWLLVPLLLTVPLLLLLFPTGRPPSSRWRWVGWAIAASAVSGVLGFTVRGPDSTPTPFLAELLLSVSAILGLAGTGLAIASVVVRFRRSRGEERAQMRWLVSIALLGTVVFVVGVVVEGAAGEGSPVALISGVLLLAILTVGIPASIGIAILRYRLYELDVVIKKTVIFAILAVLLTLVAVGTLLGASGLVTEAASSETETGAVAAALFVVGVLVWPLWRLARGIADRLVFGGRSTPYDVLTQFSRRVGETYSAEDVLPRMAHVLAKATRAEVARVWVTVGSELRLEASWPKDAPDVPANVTLGDDAVPDLGDEHLIEVHHQGELLGALTVSMPTSDPMNPSKGRLIRDLASQAGPVLRNVRLVEDLRESRRRIVSAQDERARKLERDIHDGVQQQLVAMQVKQRLAEGLVEADPARARAMLSRLQIDTATALEDLRDLARGIYPPLLADKGLPAALESQARKSPIPATVEIDSIGRYSQEIESAVYFCTLEALNNVAKYADATRVTISLSQSKGALAFWVIDDGRGFDPNTVRRGAGLQGMADRLDTVGGKLEITAVPGGGTTVRGHIPSEGTPA